MIEVDGSALCRLVAPARRTQAIKLALWPAHRTREGDGSLISRSHHAVACFALAVLPFLLAALATSEARAQTLTPFRYEEQAQRHCPGDSVVWLDFRKRRYYVHGQKLYGRGFDGSFVCLQEARSSQYRRSLLGVR